MLTGYFLPRIESVHSKVLIKGVDALYELTMKLTMFIIRFAPLGIFGLVAKTMSEQADVGAMAFGLGKYFVTVLFALFFHAFIILPILLWLLQRISPIQHFKNMTSVLLTAFSTSSSSATLPLTMEAVEHGAGGIGGAGY